VGAAGPGVDVSRTDEGIKLVASADAHRGDTGSLAIGAEGEKATGRLLVRVVELPAPTLAPIRLDPEAGKTVPVDVNQYLNSPLPPSTRKTEVLSVTPINGASAGAKVEGSKIVFTPKPDTDGVMRYRIEVSDTGGSATSGRPDGEGRGRARGRGPARRTDGSHRRLGAAANTVALTWKTPDAKR
jgi:hypothetical protein